MYKNILISTLVCLVLVSSIVYAQSYSCIDTDTSQFSTILNVDDDSITITYNETCKFSCNTETGKCEPSPYEMGLIDVSVLFAVLGIAFVMFFIHGKVEQEAFKLLFFMVGLMFVFATLLLAIILIQQSNKTIVLGAVETLVFYFEVVLGLAILLLFIFILVDAFKVIKEKNYKFW